MPKEFLEKPLPEKPKSHEDFEKKQKENLELLGKTKKFHFESIEGNKIEGRISLERDHRLGALLITEVNKEKTNYIIWGMPKIYYPYCRERQGQIDRENVQREDIDFEEFSDQAQEVIFREKVDGTNVTWFPLRNTEGEIIEVIPKTRLGIINKPSDVHSTYDLLPEIYKMYPDIKKAVEELEMSLSFEVYGYRNPHTVKYDFPLQVSLLVAIDKDGKLKSYSSVKEIAKKYKLHLPKELSFPFKGDLKEMWIKARDYLDKDNIKDKIVNEGSVVTFCYPDTMRLIKCKAKSVEEIHIQATKVKKISEENLFKAIYKVYDDGFAKEKWEEVEKMLRMELEEDFSPNTIQCHIKDLQKLWDKKLQIETIRPIVEEVVSDHKGKREMKIIMPEVRKRLDKMKKEGKIEDSKGATNLAAKIILCDL